MTPTEAPVRAIAHICERWTIPLEIDETAEPRWFLHYALSSPREAGKHLTAGWLAYTSLLSVYGPEDIHSAHETFGGMGAQSLMIQELFAPAGHSVGEWSLPALDHLRRVLPPSLTINRADAYSAALPEAELYGLDFGDLTAWRTREHMSHRALLDRAFAAEPKAVVFTDVACRYLHLHRSRYESLLGRGTCGSYPDYLRAFLARLEALYGYVLVRGYYDRWSTVMALVPDGLRERVPGELHPTPDEPIGLEVL